MSVMNCDRNGCLNVMCDRYSHTYGYICEECFNELLESSLTIEEFMNTEKSPDKMDSEIRRKEIEEEFLL